LNSKINIDLRGENIQARVIFITKTKCRETKQLSYQQNAFYTDKSTQKAHAMQGKVYTTVQSTTKARMGK